MALACLAAVVVLGAGGAARAGTVKWNGATGGGWSVATNWSPNGVPGTADDVVFDGTFKNTSMSIDTTVDVNSITLQGNYSGAIGFTGTSSNPIHVAGAVSLNGAAGSRLQLSLGTTAIDGNLSMTLGTLNGNGGALNVGGSVNETGGALTANASTTITVTGSFIEAGGTFTANSGQVQIGTFISVTSGTFRQGAGAVLAGSSLSVGGGTYTGSTGSVQVGTFLTVPSGTFTQSSGPVSTGSFLNVAGGTYNGSSGALQIGGALSVSSGAFNGNSGLIKIASDLTVSGTGTFKAASGTTRVGGAFNNSASGGGAAYNDNNGVLLFNSTTSQTHTFGGATFKKVIFNDGMVAYWNLDEGNNPFTTNTDNSGYANTGTATSVTRVTTQKPPLSFNDGSYGTFDGATSRISATVVNLPDASAPQSISVWVNITALPASAGSIVALTGASSAVKLGLSATSLQVLRADGTALVSTAAPSTGAWHHVAYTWDGLNNGLYVDGAAVAPTATTHDSGPVTGAFIGATSAAADFFSGSLDEIRIYSRALAVSEIAAMALGRTPAGGIATHTFADAYLANVGTNIADLEIASGIVTGSSPISIEGSWLNYGGRFTGTGAVTFTSNGGEAFLSGGSSFTSVTMNGTGVNGSHTLWDRMWIPNGTLTLSSTVKLSLGAYNLHVGSMSVVSGTTFTPSTGTVIIDSTTDQTLPGAVTTFYGLALEDPTELGVVGYWKLDEGTGPSTTRDWSGMNNPGTLSASGATWAAPCGSIGFDDASAMSFDGTAGSVSVGTTGLPAASASQSISAWVNITALPGSANSIVSLTGPSSAVELGLSATSLQVLRNDGTALISTTAPSTGTWHHVAYSWDGTSNNLYVDGGAATSTPTTHDGAAVTAAFLGATSATGGFFNGKLDDVRLYNVALTQAQVTRLAAGRYAGTGGYATMTLAVNTTVSQKLTLDAGNLTTSTFTVNDSYTTLPAAINAGTYEVGGAGAATAGSQTFSGGLTVQSAGALKLATTGGSVQLANGRTLIIDGSLSASSTGATIQSVTGTYTFKVGATPNARPTLNITGLAVKNLTSNGMWIDSDLTASTTFTRFDNIAFSNGTSTVSGMLLQIYSTGLFLTSNGCTFDAGITATTKYTVKLTGNGYTGAPDTTQTRAMFGGATCSATFASCQVSKSDDDGNSDGLPSTPATNGAVVQFLRAAEADTAGAVVGLPAAAFDWNTYAYYSTYVAYNSTSGSSSSIYVRNGSGAAQYSWTSPGADTIVGTPRFTTVGTTHYLYVGTAAGKIYQLVDTGSALTTTGAPWATNPYDCSCSIVTPLAFDASNLYWGGTQSGNKLWTLGQTSETQPMGSPFPLTPTITTASPALWTNAGTTYVFLGTTGHLLKIDVTNQALAADNSNPGSASVWGRIAFGTSSANRVFAGDDGGFLWAIDPANFSGTNKVWSYNVSGDSIKSSPYYHYNTNTVQFGTEAGKVVVLNSSGAAPTGYPYTPGTSSDSIRQAVFYWNGVLLIGTQTGKLFFIDRNNGTTGPALVNQYFFGPTEVVSGIGYDNATSRYMVAVADPAVKDGRIYYLDLVSDPTPTFP